MSNHLKRKNRLALILLMLGAALVIAMFVAAAFGAVTIPIPDIVKMTLNKTALFHFPVTWPPTEEMIIFQIRLPRVIAGGLVGAALATAGVLFQGLLRNPMADPYIIGTSAGASLGAAIVLLLPLNLAFLGFGLVPVAAFIGGLAAVILVYNLARVGGKTPIVSMLLSGFVVSSLLAAIMTFLISLNQRIGGGTQGVYSFLAGYISVSGWMHLAVIAPIIIGGIIAARFFALRLNTFALGEEGAAYLGVDIERNKLVILGIGSLLTAAAVSISGLVGFVGLMVPHAIRLIWGPDHRLLLPASAIAGAIFMIVADLVARVLLAPSEIPVGVITAIIGAPVFISLLRSAKKEYAF